MVEHAVQPYSHHQAVGLWLEVDVGGVALEGGVEYVVDNLDHREVLGFLLVGLAVRSVG
ncbi:MAG: hypothetical protein BWY79_00842 [Actinobacteria bacterium ADurb.Bin444]|nr:MAG: hypothetical protein BWY79_00842 [Actinobacteria bacterium ADurb.Bin444]